MNLPASFRSLIAGAAWLVFCVPSYGQPAAAENGRIRDLVRLADPSPPTETDLKRMAREREQEMLREQPARVPGSRHRTILTTDFMVRDPRGHIWAFWVDGKKFSEWDGYMWQERAVPEAVLGSNGQSDKFVADTSGQAWLWPDNGGTTCVFDFATGQWQVFQTLREAVAVRLVPGDCLAGSFVMPAPVSHRNGTKALIHLDGRIEVLRRGRWHTTTVLQAAGQSATVSDPLSFTLGGDVSVQVDEKYYALGQENSWRTVPAETVLPATERHMSIPPPRAVPGLDKIRTSLWDRTGAAWIITSDRHLHKWREGRVVPVMDGEKPLLMPDSFFADVLIDPVGNAFIVDSQWGPVVTYQFVAALSRGPMRSAMVEQSEGGMVSIKLPDQAQAQGWHRWRHGGEPWSKMTRSPLLDIPGLLPGTHQIELELVDEEFTLLAPILKWEVKIDVLASDKIRQWIQLLGSPDIERCEEAVQILVNQGSGALPALTKALQEIGAPENRQWWLRAVIQRIQREAAGTP